MTSRRLLLATAAVAVTVAGAAAMVVAAGSDPLHDSAELGRGAVGSWDNAQAVLVAAVPLVLIALGYCVAYRGGVWNIGGDGQFLAGALAGAAVALHLPALPSWAGIAIVAAAGAAAGAAVGVVIAVLSVRWSASVIVTSLLANYLLFFTVTWAVRRPLHAPGDPLPETAAIPASLLLPSLGHTTLHAGVLVVPVLVVAVAYLLGWTPIGLRLRMLAANPEATAAAGVGTGALVVSAMAVSAGVAGLAGAIQLLGPAGYLDNQISAGFGYTAIVVAMLGRRRPLGVVVAGLLLAALSVGGEAMARNAGVPAALGVVVGGLLVIMLLVADRVAVAA